MDTTFIYTLSDPISGHVRYIGKTNNLKQRYKAHTNKARKEPTHKRNWIDYLAKQGLKPVLEVIDEVPKNDWKFWECYWIQQFKIWGFNLTNATGGGDGLTMGNQTSFKKGGKVKHDTHTYIECEQCNEMFKISPSRIGIKKFCSKSCYAQNKKGKSIINNGSFKQGFIPWNKGLNYSRKYE